MKDVVHIVGHRNSDTDSIISAIAYAQLKQRLRINAIVCRLGELNPETDSALEGFQMPEPVHIQNARIKLYDVPFDEPPLLKKDDTIKEARDRMRMRFTSALFVVDEAQKPIGAASLPDMTSTLVSNKGEKSTSLMKDTSHEGIRKVLQSEFLYKCDAYRTNERIHILCSHNAEYSDINYRDSIIIVNDDLKLQKRVLSNKTGCVILVDVGIIPQGIVRMAREANCTIIKAPLNMFQVVRSMYHSSSMKLIMKRKTISFGNHACIDDVYRQVSKSGFYSYPVVNNQSMVLGSISRYHLLNYQKRKFTLVDHNEPSQNIDDLKEAEIPEIVDHHHISDVEATIPIRFHNEIIDGTASIITRMYKEAGLIPEVKTATAMYYAIISDTMDFNSPTTTPIDEELTRELAAIAGVELGAMAEEMFGAVAMIKGRTISKILYNDFKEYNIDGEWIVIGQISIADEQEIVNTQDEIHAYVGKINEINKFDLFMMCSTTTDGSGSNLVLTGILSYLVDRAFKEDTMDELYFVDGVISRKRQIAPALSKCPESM